MSRPGSPFSDSGREARTTSIKAGTEPTQSSIITPPNAKQLYEERRLLEQSELLIKNQKPEIIFLAQIVALQIMKFGKNNFSLEGENSSEEINNFAIKQCQEIVDSSEKQAMKIFGHLIQNEQDAVKTIKIGVPEPNHLFFDEKYKEYEKSLNNLMRERINETISAISDFGSFYQSIPNNVKDWIRKYVTLSQNHQTNKISANLTEQELQWKSPRSNESDEFMDIRLMEFSDIDLPDGFGGVNSPSSSQLSQSSPKTPKR